MPSKTFVYTLTVAPSLSHLRFPWPVPSATVFRWWAAGDNVSIGPYIDRGNIIKTDESEENIDNENIELIFGIRIIHENNESLLQELNFRHTILASEYELGDVNRDNVINVQDVVMLVQYILTLQEFDQEQERLADITEDGVINILDVVNLVQGILGN